jgi:predicted ABC-type ATPase
MIVVAGPPGSGKSTFFPIAAMGVDSFSIDDRCAQILGSYRAIPPAVRKAVSQECERFVDDHIQNRRSFAVEPTMRTLVAIRQAERARDQGFQRRSLSLGRRRRTLMSNRASAGSGRRTRRF